jgi:hypothetical protein
MRNSSPPPIAIAGGERFRNEEKGVDKIGTLRVSRRQTGLRILDLMLQGGNRRGGSRSAVGVARFGNALGVTSVGSSAA